MKEAAYNSIAKFYDAVLGRTGNEINYIRDKINAYNKTAKTVLELGCGTGINLLPLSKKYKVTGVDISEKMIRIAQSKIPDGDFILDDIRRFTSEKKFDVILCLYDTINHLTLFSEWKALFKIAFNNLNPNGIFIFDINTLYKLRFITEISPLVHRFNSNILIMDVKNVSVNVFNWNLRIFENTKKNNYLLNEVNIKESSFDLKNIKDELKKLFAILNIEDVNSSKVTAKTERIYFVCKKIS